MPAPPNTGFIDTDFVLFAAAAEPGSPLWNGASAPTGVLLRWLLPLDLPFPDAGFRIYGAPAPSPLALKLPGVSLGGADTPGGTVLDHGIRAFSDRPIPPRPAGLRVGTGDEVTLVFPSPVSVLTVRSGQGSGTLTVRTFVGAGPITTDYDSRDLGPAASVEWTTRGISSIVVSGDGTLTDIEFRSVDGPYKWQCLKHLCLPLTHPAYGCSHGRDDFEEARSRLPAGTPWDGHYRETFEGIHAVLGEILSGSAAPFPALGTDGDAGLEVDRQTALFLALLDPNVARMLGFAFDHEPGNFPRDDHLAYKVEGIWGATAADHVVRTALVPAVRLRETRPPAPRLLRVSVDAPAGRPRAGVSWVPVPKRGPTADPPVLRYQVLSRALGGLDLAPPAIPTLQQGDLVGDGGPILLTPDVLNANPPVPFVYQRGLSDGHHAFGVRSVDLFGRVSEPTSRLVRLEDTSPPPAPRLVDARYDEDTGTIVVVWSWPPSLAERAPDVDAFEVHCRRPAVVTSAQPLAAAIDWDAVAWGPVRFAVQPVATILRGVAASVESGVPVRVTRVEGLAGGAARVETDLELRQASGRLIGAQLRAVGGGPPFVVAAHGEGPATSLVVTGTGSATLAPGEYQLTDGAGRLMTVAFDLDRPSHVDPHHEAGIVAYGENGRLQVLQFRNGRAMGVLMPPVPDGVPVTLRTGDRGAWYPGYRTVLHAAGFGPQPGPGHTVAQAQVTVRALRPAPGTAQARIPGPHAAPQTVVAVDRTVPPAPQVPDLPAGDHCAMLATPADYYGISRFRLTWPAQTNVRYRVYRALRSTLLREDLAAQRAGLPTHTFADADLPDDDRRREVVRRQVGDLDAAIAAGRDAAVAAAYAALGADAVQAIGSRDELRGAFTALCTDPIGADRVPFEDQFDGRAHGSWIYRVAAVSEAGVESDWSVATPPICAPDVVAPPPPQFQEVLASEGEVVLRWLRSPASDLAVYRLFRSAEEGITDTRDMQEVAVVTPAPDAQPSPGQTAPVAVPGQPAWLEHRDPVAGGIPFRYVLVAEDTHGNVSQPSRLATGRALRARPVAPVWNPPVRNGDTVELSWTHPDPGLSCLVERRVDGAGAWRATSGWLPRGQYQSVDRPLGPSDTLEYRLRVKDQAGLVAASRPVITLPPEP